MAKANKFDDVNAAIVAGASLPDVAPLEAWLGTADAFSADPTMDNFKQLKAASHNLARVVRSVGVDITPDRLARAADSDYVPDRPSTPENERVDAYIARRYPGR